MIRKIIHIDEEKCNGCGACASACQEGAIAMVDGKARLMRDDYCDGLGNCLPACPTGAITFVEREAAAYDEAAVEKHLKERAEKALEHVKPVHGGCPGMMARAIRRENAPAPAAAQEMPSQLSQWPVQIRLVPVNAPYFDGAKLLIAADCTAYAYANFYRWSNFGRIRKLSRRFDTRRVFICPFLCYSEGTARKRRTITAENGIGETDDRSYSDPRRAGP